MNYVDCLFRYSTDEDFLTAMETLGYRVSRNLSVESELEHCATPPVVTHTGNIRMVRFTDESRLAGLPEALTPTFLIDLRSDEDNTDYDPTYTKDYVDEDGNIYVGPVDYPRFAK